MSIFSFHLLHASLPFTIKAVLAPPTNIPGLKHMECMTLMTLGSPVFSTSRMLPRQLAVFAHWENEDAIDDFLKTHAFGKKLASGWHTRLRFLRQWGRVDELDIHTNEITASSPEAPVVAVTLARMRLTEVPRFIRWGRPVEKLVRDHPATTLSLAAFRFPRTVSTFSIWRSQKEMLDMVRGHSPVPAPGRHIDAMNERERKDFHFQFTTIRFQPIAEYGSWNGKTQIIPKLFPLR